jgi:hypothetical protein
MNWQARDPIEFRGKILGQKDVEFAKFIDLPSRVDSPMEVAVAGKEAPRELLRGHGWSVRSAFEVTKSFDSYVEYIQKSSGEFSVSKNVYVATHSGWFSERSAAYLASGRPVVAQDTGFSQHLPCGRGVFAVNDVFEASDAIQEIWSDWPRQSRWAREFAREYLDVSVTLKSFLDELQLER